MDHRQVACKLVRDWSTRRDGRKTALHKLKYMSRWDAMLVLLLMIDYSTPDEAGEMVSAIGLLAHKRPETVSPLDCAHDHTLQVQSGESGGPGRPHTSELVMVCSDCGQFCMTASRGDVRITTTFELPTWPLVDAAARYAWHLEEEEI